MDKVNNEETTLEVVRSRSPIAIAFLICLVVYILNRIMKDVLPCLYSLRRRRSTSDEEEDLPSGNVEIATNLHETEHEDINAGDVVILRGNDTDKYHVVGSKIGNGERFTCYARPYVGQDQSPDNLELVKSAGDSPRRRRSTSDEEEDLLSEDVKIATNPPETEHEDINVGDVVRIRGKCMDEYHVVRSKLGNGERFSCSATPLVSQDLSPDNLELIKSAGEDALDMVIGTEYLCSRKMLVQVEGEPLHPVTLEENDKFIVSKDFRNGMVEGKNSRYEQSLYVPALLLKKSKELNR